MGKHAREVQRVGMVRRCFEDRAVDVRRSFPLLCLLQRDGDRDRFVKRERSVSRSAYAYLFVLRSYLK